MASYFPMIKNSAQRIVFPILDADGDPVTGAVSDTPVEEYSLDGGSFGACSNTLSELATTSGVYYLDLLAAETNGDVVAIQIKTATAGTKTTVLVFYTSAQSLDTIDTVVDGIQTDLSNGSDGLGALATLIGAVPTTAQIQTEMEADGDSLLDTIRDDLANTTDGLGALLTAIEAVAGDATAANQETLIQILTGKWEVVDNQLIMYDTDGTTALYTFDLTRDGTLTEFNPDLRTPV